MFAGFSHELELNSPKSTYANLHVNPNFRSVRFGKGMKPEGIRINHDRGSYSPIEHSDPNFRGLSASKETAGVVYGCSFLSSQYSNHQLPL